MRYTQKLVKHRAFLGTGSIAAFSSSLPGGIVILTTSSHEAFRISSLASSGHVADQHSGAYQPQVSEVATLEDPCETDGFQEGPSSGWKVPASSPTGGGPAGALCQGRQDRTLRRSRGGQDGGLPGKGVDQFLGGKGVLMCWERFGQLAV